MVLAVLSINIICNTLGILLVYNLCHKKLSANQQVSDRDVKKMRMVLAVLSNNIFAIHYEGYYWDTICDIKNEVLVS